MLTPFWHSRKVVATQWNSLTKTFPLPSYRWDTQFRHVERCENCSIIYYLLYTGGLHYCLHDGSCVVVCTSNKRRQPCYNFHLALPAISQRIPGKFIHLNWHFLNLINNLWPNLVFPLLFVAPIRNGRLESIRRRRGRYRREESPPTTHWRNNYS